ncbi:MAG: type II toxin-antitoxin system Phd/YefM family antitoxin [Candidatus Limnocylindria bacterium]
MAIDMVAVADLRARISAVLEELQARAGPLYVTQRGRARAVLLSVEGYRALLEQLEYLDDSLEALRARERRASGEERTETWTKMKRELLGRARASR